MKKPVFIPTSELLVYNSIGKFRGSRIFKRYKITPHIEEGIFILEHRKTIFSKWKFLYNYNIKSDAIKGIEKQRKTRSEYY